MRSLLVVCAAVAVGIAAASVSAADNTASDADPCARYTRCSECVYDAYPPMSLEPLPCTWCEATMTCSSNASATCPNVRRATDAQPMCGDMQCAASRTTGNIYWCRAGTVVAAIFAFLLLIVTLVYWTWMRAVHQLPWKYPKIHQALDQLQTSGAAVRLVSRARASQGACPICHCATGKTYAPGGVCFWCDVARLAFVPFAVGLGCSLVAIFSLFCLSLRPSFADWYYALLLVVPYGVYTCFAAWVLLTQRPVHGDDEQRPTTFASLAIELRGRELSSVFALESGGDAVEPAHAASATSLSFENDSPTENASIVSEADQHADTMQSLELDTEIPSTFRSVLRDAMRPDEFIAWTERPSSSVIIVDSRWLIASFGAGAVLGLFFLLIASIQPSSYPTSLMAAGPMRLAGFVILLVSLFLLAATVSSLQRQYVLTNKRLFFLSSGLFSSTHVLSTELHEVSHASVHGYQELGYTVLTFAWGTAPKAGRKMPVLHPQGFVGISSVEELLSKFSEHCHSVDSSSQKATFDQRRTTWRIHLGALVFCAAIAPIVLVSPQLLPSDLALFALLWWWFFCATLAQRGWRVLSTTSAHLNLAKEWGRFGGGFSLSRLVPGAIGRRMPRRRPSVVVRSVARPQSPSAAAATSKKPATEL